MPRQLTLEEDNPEYLPEVRELPEEALALIPEPQPLDINSSLKKAQEADVPVANAMLMVIHAMWPSVRTIDSAIKMVNVTMKTLEGRRKLLNLQYGTTGQISKNDVIEPPD
jgi:hypothetical protein